MSKIREPLSIILEVGHWRGPIIERRLTTVFLISQDNITKRVAEVGAQSDRGD